MRRRGSRIARYVGARLHRRLFAWFGVAIVVTGMTVGLVMTLSTSGNPWQRDLDGLRAIAGERFERAWDDPAEREALARSLEKRLDLCVSLEDAAGGSLGSFGGTCETRPWTLSIERGGRRLGVVTLRRRRGADTTGLLLSLAAACVALWGMSGQIARRLSRPLVELARVAGEIGAGRYSARVRLRRHDGEVGVLEVALNDMASRIERQMADQRELLAAVSHEIRTPLSRVRLLVELARDGASPGVLDEVDREVVEIDGLVGELLASSRLDFSALTPSVQGAAEAALRSLERAGKGASLLVDEAAGARLSADATLLSRALANLIDNADKHGGGLSAMRVTSRPGFVRFEAEDAGPGLAAGDEVKAFEPFYRRPRTGDQGSLGLGLSLVRRIAEAHGGHAGAANRPAGGACVWVELPACDPASSEAPGG